MHLLVLVDTRPAYDFPEDLDTLTDREAVRLALAYAKMSEGLYALQRVWGGQPNLN